MRIFILIILLALSLAGCARAPSVYLSKPSAQSGAERSRYLLAGKWLGEAEVKEGGSKMWVNERSSDGTYVITFRNVSPRGEIEVSQEYGIWGLSADVYFTKMLGWIEAGQKHPNGGSDSYYDDAYFVKKITADDFAYEAVTTKELFHVKKVPDDYKLP